MSKDSKDDDVEYYHDFTEDEAVQMFYLIDEENSAPVKEYIYMKEAWKTPDAIVGGPTNATKTSNKKNKDEVPSMQKNAIDTGQRSLVDLDKDAPKGEELVYLDLDTEKTAQVVEFYAPWCPHCKHFKYEYIDIAREVTRRTIETPVEFHAVSCGLFRELCRAYGINGFPIVYGWPVGSSVWDEDGIELNPPHEPPMTADSLAEALDITLAHEAKDVQRHNFSDSEDERLLNKELIKMAKQAAKLKLKWQQYPSDLDERYHNAAASLTFVLKNAVVMDEQEKLNNRRALALKDFVDLVGWATPQTWHIRSGLVHDMQRHMEDIVNGTVKLESVVERHQSTDAAGRWWGGLIQKQKPKRLGLGDRLPNRASTKTNIKDRIRANSKWSPACTHVERGMGFTCGLWDLFHILTIGSTFQSQQILGFQAGSLTSPRDVAEIIKRFILAFFPCDVCRFNFKDMYQNCGHDHCKRLVGVMPDLLSVGNKNETEVHPVASDQSRRELPLWLWEVHNSVNVRLMKENAAREGRVVSKGEIVAAKFPSRRMCPQCWVDKDMEKWNREAVLQFLTNWYWPTPEGLANSRLTMGRRLLLDVSGYHRAAVGYGYTKSMAIILIVTIGAIAVHKRIRSKGPKKKNEGKEL